MSKRDRSNFEAVSPTNGTEEAFGNIWRSYCAMLSGHSGLRLLIRALKRPAQRRMVRHVYHATFEQLSSAGYDVKTFDDGAVPLDPEKSTRRNLPEGWKIPQSVIAPKIATLRDTVLFMDGAALLPGSRFCWFDTHFSVKKWHAPREFNVAPARTLLYADRATDSALIRCHMGCIDVPGRCFSTLAGRHYENFGHFVHDVLTRVYYEDLGAIVPGRVKVIAPPMLSSMQKALFHKVFENYEIIQIPPDTALKAEELLLPANLCNEESFNPAAIAALAKRMRRIMAHHVGKAKKKVCVSRNDTEKLSPKRNFANVEAYETRMRKLGYRILNASELDPEEQFALWTNTTDIVGIHGLA